MIIKGREYNYEIEYNGKIFTIIPIKDLKSFDALCFVEDLDNLFIAVNKAMELKYKDVRNQIGTTGSVIGND